MQHLESLETEFFNHKQMLELIAYHVCSVPHSPPTPPPPLP